jgi:phosphoglycolate phosphatase
LVGTPDHPDYDQLEEEFFVNYEACLTERTFAFEGVSQLIQQLQDLKMPWGVVTNKSKRFTEPLTQVMPLFSSAAVVISGDTTPHAEPHPAPLLEAAKRMGVNPAACVYVGDDERDIVAGHAAHMENSGSHLRLFGCASGCTKLESACPN